MTLKIILKCLLFIICMIFYMIFNVFAYCGTSNNFSNKISDTTFRQIQSNDNAHLIKENTYYECKVVQIHKLKNSYGIELHTLINNLNVYAYVISKKEKNINSIKIGKTYKFKFLRYFENQLSGSIEYKEVYDVMLGNKTVGILSVGWFNYLFVTPNLNSLNYIDSLNVDIIENNIKKNEEKLQKFICDFIKSISFNEYSNNLRENVDSTLLMTSLKSYFVPIVLKSPLDRANVPPPRRIPYLKWERYNIDDKKFNSLFWGMLDTFYKLPIKEDSKDFDCKDVYIKTLYFFNDICTIRIKWKLPSKDAEYVAIVSLREFEQTFKIIGFNKTTLENYSKYNNNYNNK